MAKKLISDLDVFTRWLEVHTWGVYADYGSQYQYGFHS